MVTICPVTLGKEIGKGGRLEPKNVEKPICFANYLIQTAVLENTMEEAAQLLRASEQAKEEYQRRSLFRKVIGRKPTILTEEQKAAIEDLLNNGKEDLDSLRSVIEGLPLYINGERIEWPD